MKRLRILHLYMGCFFAPLLIFFVVSGCLQAFGLHEAKKSSYSPPVVLETMAEAHMHQRLAHEGAWSKHSAGFRYLIVLMSLGFLATTVTGIIMALKTTRPVIVWTCLLAGVIIPSLLLLMARG